MYFELPTPGFRVKEGEDARCRTIPMPKNARFFGNFQEKTLECTPAAKAAIDKLCNDGGFTQSWEPAKNKNGMHVMIKIPAVILVKIMLGLPEDKKEEAESMRGAFPIAMSPYTNTCMNVIVGRHKSESGKWVLDKFSLYWPNNQTAERRYKGLQSWPLVQGYAFRTAVLQGTLNRGSLRSLQRSKYVDLVVDSQSAFEDCAYVKDVVDESDEVRRDRIDKMVDEMEKDLGNGSLAPSYDPDEKGISALKSEWMLLKKQMSCPPPAQEEGEADEAMPEEPEKQEEGEADAPKPEEQEKDSEPAS